MNGQLCPVCVEVHEQRPIVPPSEPIDRALTGDAHEPPRVQLLSDEERARRVREEWNVPPPTGGTGNG